MIFLRQSRYGHSGCNDNGARQFLNRELENLMYVVVVTIFKYPPEQRFSVMRTTEQNAAAHVDEILLKLKVRAENCW